MRAAFARFWAVSAYQLWTLGRPLCVPFSVWGQNSQDLWTSLIQYGAQKSLHYEGLKPGRCFENCSFSRPANLDRNALTWATQDAERLRNIDASRPLVVAA